MTPSTNPRIEGGEELIDFLCVDERPGQDGCANPECGQYPYYGVAPHECFYKRGAEFTIGQSIGLPPSEWPANFVIDLEEGETPETVAYPSACGIYYCPTCVEEGRVLATASPAAPNDRTREDPENSTPGEGEPNHG